MGPRSPPSHLFVCILCCLELWGQLDTAEVGNGLFVTLYHSLPKEELLVCFKSVLDEPVKVGGGDLHPSLLQVHWHASWQIGKTGGMTL